MANETVTLTKDERDLIVGNMEAVLSMFHEVQEAASDVMAEIFEFGLLNDFGLPMLVVLQEMEQLDQEIRVRIRDTQKSASAAVRAAPSVANVPRPVMAPAGNVAAVNRPGAAPGVPAKAAAPAGK
jgi:hypothetical protein